MLQSITMGSGTATNDLTSPSSPSSASSPRFNEPEALSFERPTMKVGRYRILSELGRGGMSNVFLAVASGPGGVNKLVVLKALLSDLSTEAYALSMFMDEARLAAQLNHPNVVQTYEVGTEGDRHVIVMEYLEGQSLSGVVRRAAQEGSQLPLPIHLRIIINALEGLHYAHELCGYEGAPLQLVHRDISPQNVFVTYDGQAKVLDFGIAKATSASTHTATGIMKGKIAYMAPEQMLGGNVDRRADLYSVGCMLWAAATGYKLWKDVPDVQVMRRAIAGDVPTPQSVNSRCDDELNRIVLKALASEPSDRYSTAVELQHDLELYAESLGPTAKQKDIGRYVSGLFADTRSQLKALVEKQITLIQSDNSSISASRERARPGTSTTLGGATSESSATLLAEPVPPAGRTKRRIIAGVALLALVGGLSVFGWGHRSSGGELPAAPEKAAASLPALAVPPVAVAAPAIKRVTIAFQASPQEAKLYVDDEALPSNPATKLVAVDGKTHVLRAEAPGYSRGTTEFMPTQDTTLDLSLTATEQSAHSTQSSGSRRVLPRLGTGRPAPGVVTATATPGAPATAAPAAPTVAAAAKPNCDNPIFLDKDGIRRVRPECR